MESTQQIDEAAGDWLARRDAGDWTAADQESFDRWLNESTLHRVAYLRLERAWEDALRLKALGAGVRSQSPPPPGQWNLTPFFSRRSRSSEAADSGAVDTKRSRTAPRRWHALVASLLIAAVLGVASYLRPSVSYQTPVGGVASLPMADGSKVILNTDSAIKVSMTDTERRVDLRYGEAFFDVAKDPRRPFVVKAGDKRIVAVGTRFSVRREADDVRVVVTEGAVRVEPLGEAKGKATELLTAGSVVFASHTGLSVQHKQPAEAEEQLSWRSGVLVFRDTTLADAVAEFNRYNRRKILIDDPTVAALRIAGNFRATNVDAFARLLEQGYPLSVQSKGGSLVLIAR